MTDAQTFPVQMTHPAFRPATLGMGEHVGTPIKFPPVVVHDQKQYDYHTSQGYVPGRPPPGAFDAVAPADPTEPGHEYPKWVRNAARTKEALVGSPAEEAAAVEQFAREEVDDARRAAEAATLAAATASGASDMQGQIDELRQSQQEARAGLSRMEAMLELLLEQKTAPAPSAAPGKPKFTGGERAG